MKKIKQGAAALALLMFSGIASAIVPTTPVSWDRYIGILDKQYFNQTFSVENYLLHSYTFDLLSDSNVNATLVNLIPESGHIFEPGLVIFKRYDIGIYDSSDNLLYMGANTQKYWWGSTLEAKVSGMLPAGEDYHLVITGGAIPSDEVPALGYDILIQATSVPEPQTWAMLTAGLGVMGFMARRRKQGLA